MYLHMILNERRIFFQFASFPQYNLVRLGITCRDVSPVIFLSFWDPKIFQFIESSRHNIKKLNSAGTAPSSRVRFPINKNKESSLHKQEVSRR